MKRPKFLRALGRDAFRLSLKPEIHFFYTRPNFSGRVWVRRLSSCGCALPRSVCEKGLFQKPTH